MAQKCWTRILLHVHGHNPSEGETMPTLETIEIKSIKDPTQRWIINLEDFDPAQHTKWEAENPPLRRPVGRPPKASVSSEIIEAEATDE
jgi:hypothetical protein